MTLDLGEATLGLQTLPSVSVCVCVYRSRPRTQGVTPSHMQLQFYMRISCRGTEETCKALSNEALCKISGYPA